MEKQQSEMWAIVGTEEWKPIEEYEGLYEISSFGRIKRVGRSAITGKGKGEGARVGRILSELKQKGGYVAVQLWKNGTMKRYLVHCLVAKMFLGPVPDGKEVNHKDGIKKHNSIDNLEYLTRSENNKHAYHMGLMTGGEAHVWAKLTEKDVIDILDAHRTKGLGCRRLARAYGVSKNTIQLILSNKNWKEVARG